MGLGEAVRAACTDTAGARIVDEDGTVVESFSAEDDGGDGFIADIEILRGDLSQVLYDATRDDVEYVFGDRIAALAQDSDGVDVTFASGGARRFELVIGADGLHSPLRALAFGPHERFVRHLGQAMAFYTVPNEFGLDRWLIDCVVPGRSAGLRPIRDATLGMALFSFTATEDELADRDPAAQKALLRDKLAGLGWLTPQILEHADAADDFYLDAVAQVVLDRWSTGRVALAGDAAFCSSPMSGQGTSLALVGAYVLAGELAAAEWHPATGFEAYERLLRPMVDANQQIARWNAAGRTAPGPGAEPAIPPEQWDPAVIERAINGIDLPDYPGGNLA